MKIYALYKGEELLSIGTVYQIANEMDVGIKTIKYYKTNAYKRKLLNRKNGKFENQRSLILLEN